MAGILSGRGAQVVFRAVFRADNRYVLTYLPAEVPAGDHAADAVEAIA